jgi:hypothetical protein
MDLVARQQWFGLDFRLPVGVREAGPPRSGP